jgi:hypothetical protein
MGHLRLDHIEELAKFLRAAAVQLANHAAGLQFQRGKERSRGKVRDCNRRPPFSGLRGRRISKIHTLCHISSI